MTMPRLFFVWEKSSTGWSPVVYHGEFPGGKSVNGVRPDIHPQYGVIELTPYFIGSDGQPQFGKIIKAYPLPE